MRVDKLNITILILILLIVSSLVFVLFIKKPSSLEKEGEEEKVTIEPYTDKEISPEIITKIEKPIEKLKVYPSKISCEPSNMPPSGKVYFSLSRRGDNIGVYTLNLTTRKIEEFLVGDNNIWFLRFSPDGKKIVYLSDIEGETQIYIADENKQN
ncbi:MAG: hypothetical protein NZ870_04880, partial [bacterium]|nr:hypothetical protein [bacterium]